MNLHAVRRGVGSGVGRWRHLVSLHGFAGTSLTATGNGFGVFVPRVFPDSSRVPTRKDKCPPTNLEAVMTDDGHEARMELASWFAKMLEELDEDHVTNPEAILNLKGRVARAFAEWRMATGYGMSGPGTGPETE